MSNAISLTGVGVARAIAGMSGTHHAVEAAAWAAHAALRAPAGAAAAIAAPRKRRRAAAAETASVNRGST